MKSEKNFGLPEELNTDAELAVDAQKPRKDFSIEFTNLNAVVDTAEENNGKPVEVSVNEKMQAKRDSLNDELRRRGKI